MSESKYPVGSLALLGGVEAVYRKVPSGNWLLMQYVHDFPGIIDDTVELNGKVVYSHDPLIGLEPGAIVTGRLTGDVAIMATNRLWYGSQVNGSTGPEMVKILGGKIKVVRSKG